MAKKLIDEADSFIVITQAKESTSETKNEQTEDDPSNAKDEVTHKAYTLVTPKDSVAMLEYLFKRLPDIPRAVIELREAEMKDAGVWVPKE